MENAMRNVLFLKNVFSYTLSDSTFVSLQSYTRSRIERTGIQSDGLLRNEPFRLRPNPWNRHSSPPLRHIQKTNNNRNWKESYSWFMSRRDFLSDVLSESERTKDSETDHRSRRDPEWEQERPHASGSPYPCPQEGWSSYPRFRRDPASIRILLL